MSFLLVLKLDIENFLLDFLLVTLLKTGDVACALFGFLDFFPGFHLFLFQEGDTVGEKLGVAVDTKERGQPKLKTLTLFSFA